MPTKLQKIIYWLEIIAFYCLGSFLFLLLWDKLEYASLDWAYYL